MCETCFPSISRSPSHVHAASLLQYYRKKKFFENIFHLCWHFWYDITTLDFRTTMLHTIYTSGILLYIVWACGFVCFNEARYYTGITVNIVSFCFSSSAWSRGNYSSAHWLFTKQLTDCLSIVAVSNVTAVCASAAPFMLLPVLNMIAVLQRNTLSTWDVVPRLAPLAIYQKMFSALAPPVI